jgi:hypothetical protein
MTHVKQSSSNKATHSAFAEIVLLTQSRSSARISTGDARGFFFDLLKSSFL